MYDFQKYLVFIFQTSSPLLWNRRKIGTKWMEMMMRFQNLLLTKTAGKAAVECFFAVLLCAEIIRCIRITFYSKTQTFRLLNIHTTEQQILAICKILAKKEMTLSHILRQNTSKAKRTTTQRHSAFMCVSPLLLYFLQCIQGVSNWFS